MSEGKAAHEADDGQVDLDFDEEVKLDTYYIENWSLWLDIQILLKTPKVVLFPKREAL